MLDRLLVSLGFAAIGGALVYFLWGLVTRRISARRAVRADPPPETAPAADEAGTEETAADGMTEIRKSLADLSRAQVTIMERFEDALDVRPSNDDGQEAVASQLVALSAKLDTLADRSPPEAVMAEGMGALDGRLTAIEDGLTALAPADDAADRDAAMADAMEALANRLEGVETGLGTMLQQAETAVPAQPDAQAQAEEIRATLEAALENVLPSEALPALETRLTERLSALSMQVETARTEPEGEGAAAYGDRFAAIEARLAEASDQRAAEQETLAALSDGMSGLLAQFDRPAEIAFSEEALTELQAGLRDVLENTGQGEALAGTLAALDGRLDGMQTRLDALAPDRSAGRTVELIGAISALQTDAARLKSGIEQGLERFIAAAGESAERIAALDGRIAALETQIRQTGESTDTEAVASLARRLEDITRADLPASVSEALQSERDALAGSIAGMIAERLAQSPAADPEAGDPAPPERGPTLAPTSPVATAADTGVRPGSEPRADTGSPPMVESPEPRTVEDPAGVPSATMPVGPVPLPSDHRSAGPAAAGLARGTAESARAESALLRARPGLATVVSRHALRTPNGEDV